MCVFHKLSSHFQLVHLFLCHKGTSRKVVGGVPLSVLKIGLWLGL
jgi:hypothetical protein